MHRKHLIDLLNAYIPSHHEDADAASQIRSFVTSTPHCFERTNRAGHITGSAWIVSPDTTSVLLCIHRKLGRWLQPGGHSDGDPRPLSVAAREAVEETGLVVTPVSEGIFDCDIHQIPAHGTEPEHLHYDIRFAFVAPSLDFTLSSESIQLAWYPISTLNRVTTEVSLLRMGEKWLAQTCHQEIPST